jgi:8-oxo-dGTP pyrophosphatase MutT (NUDIX family)
MSDRHHHLRRLLTAHAVSEAAEVAHRDRMLELAAHADAFERSAFVPGHFTASGFVLSPERDALLLILHRRLQLWAQPGGHVEGGDTDLLSAARREVTEEVGLSDLLVEDQGRIFDLDVHPIPARPGEPEHEHFDVRFLFVAASREFCASPEVADCKWVQLSDLDSWVRDASVRRAASRIRSRAAHQR